MSEQDSFISEVSEEVRRDKLFRLFKKYGWIPVVLIIVIVGGATIFEVRNARAQAAAEASGDAILAALETANSDDRVGALNTLARQDDGGTGAIAAFLVAASEAEAGDIDAAIATLDGIASNDAVTGIYRDLAVLKAAILGAGRVAPSERIARLDAIAIPNAPFRLLAIEQIAIAEVEDGNVEGALTTLNGILADGGATQGLRQRVQQLIVSLGGTVAAI